MHTRAVGVAGMSCDHCVRAVTEEVAKIRGVERVEVDLPRGTVTVSSTDPLGLEELTAAIEEAGYEVAR